MVGLQSVCDLQKLLDRSVNVGERPFFLVLHRTRRMVIAFQPVKS